MGAVRAQVPGENRPSQADEMLSGQILTRLFLRGLGELLVLHTKGDQVLIGNIAVEKGKAVFKDNTDAFGDVMTGAGLAALSASSYNRNGGNRNLGQAGAIMTLLGAAAKITSDLTKPEADIRYWDNLPEIVYMATAPKARLVHPLTPADVAVWAYNQAGEPVPVLQGVTPAVYPTTVTDRADCDWLGIEPRHHPLSPEHVNR